MTKDHKEPYTGEAVMLPGSPSDVKILFVSNDGHAEDPSQVGNE